MCSARPASLFICALAVAFLWAPLTAEKKASPTARGLQAPKDPSAPSVDLRDPKNAGSGTSIPATIVTARGDKTTGFLAVTFTSIEVESLEDGRRRKMTVAVADIESIEFTRWRGVERRKNEFVFHPSEMKIILRDRKSLLCTGSVPLLSRLPFTHGGENRFVYSYFYDYRRNDAWKNSGQAKREYPETNPFGDTLVKIIFIREEMKNPLEKLLSR
jgi:hypothetical protein